MSECSHEHERGAVCGNCGHRLGYLLYESEQAIAFERALSDSLMKINDELKARIAELERRLAVEEAHSEKYMAEVERLRDKLTQWEEWYNDGPDTVPKPSSDSHNTSE